MCLVMRHTTRVTLVSLMSLAATLAPTASSAGVVNFASDNTWVASAMNPDQSVGPALGYAECYPIPVAFDTGQVPGACCVWLPGWTPQTPSDLVGAFFSKALVVPGAPVSGTIWVAVDDWVQVSVNGVPVCTRGSVTDYASAHAAQNPPLAYDLMPYLVSGTNAVQVWVRNGPSVFAGDCMPCAWSQNGVWVYFGGSITYDNPVAATRTSWGVLKTIYR